MPSLCRLGFSLRDGHTGDEARLLDTRRHASLLAPRVLNGELPSVVVEMLGGVLVDVGQRHCVFEVGIPARWEVHCSSQSFLGFSVEATVQGDDDTVEFGPIRFRLNIFAPAHDPR